ncbi:hypothetical protein BRADI_1g01178v3 [Brachypodium distachyon]|uniref:Uncharacterized protein n=1 Tax=Brachypodium distachyon TaxID=15368 RepID=A0A2K2DHL9_BRADI|nr:hypothetical protein BRADI_1g01178v3 [Brachypodium distachyon]
MKGRTHRWAWKTGPWPLPRDFEGRHLGFVRSYAVHPDGRTIFASSTPDFTFSLDAGTGVSAARGRWCLPFEGRAIGAVDDDDDFNRRSRCSSSFRLCCCDVPDDDLLYVYDDDELRPGRSGGDTRGDVRRRALVHTGRGRFCLVEIWPTAPSKESPCTCSCDGVEHRLLVTMFRAKHGKNGELVVSPCRPGRSYIVPNYRSDPPVAFWM